ncbi:MAG: ATP-binding protein [Solirubrobacteraceae bacterium]
MGSEGALIGRESELAKLEADLTCSRLVTVTGAGGCGKTRLALELADRVARKQQPPACAVAELSSIADEQQLVDALLAAAGVRERFGSTPTQVLLEFVAQRSVLLVLDNCEHLLAPVGALTGELLGAGAELRVLATSREPLAVPAERVLVLRPLSVPGPAGGVGAVVRSDAARLFVDRAARSNPRFALTPAVAGAVAKICRELDGLPLALELAAARLDVLSAHEIADGLARHGRLSAATGDDGIGRHSSLHASLDWSYQLLDDPERLLLRRLSRFCGGFTAPAARAVAAPETSPERVQRMLDALEAKGLIVPMRAGRERRWTFLETVGEYAAAQLAAAGESEPIADLHLRWFRGYAARADSLLLEERGQESIDHERPNLRLALDRAVEHDASCALDIAASLMCYWVLAEHYREARSACAAVLSAVGEDADPAACAVVHCGAGLIGMLSEDYAGAIASTQPVSGCSATWRIQAHRPRVCSSLRWC